MNEDKDTKLFIVDTIISYRMKYAIEAKSLEHAYDELTMRDSGNSADDFDEITQKCLGEQIIDGREISKDEFKILMGTLSTDESEMSSYWMEDKLIRKINYDRR